MIPWKDEEAMLADPQMAQKTLRRAAEIVEVGWCRDALARSNTLEPLVYVDPKGWVHQVDLRDAVVGVDLFCIRGAMMKAQYEFYGSYRKGTAAAATDDLAVAMLRRRLARSDEIRTIPYYNDFVCKSGDEAAGKLREAADAFDR